MKDIWQHTKLWKTIERIDDPEKASITGLINIIMPDIENLLKSGATTPKDFTLHDEDHSFRVAERMVEIIPPETYEYMSIYELTFLLLSAYLHDIGMSPGYNYVDRHYDCLLTGNKEILQPDEFEQLQHWLDDQQDEIQIPIEKGKNDFEKILKAREIITYYIRSKHNDLSEDWINKNLTGKKLGSFINWQDYLIKLCKSHHYGFNELIESEFDPFLVGGFSSRLHLRYLALCLRVADVLEVDPERTPEVLIRHRDISSKSLVYWWKDHQISLKLVEKKISITARPTLAIIHKAVLDTVEQINNELILCNRIMTVKPLETIGLEKALPYKWLIEPQVYEDIKAHNGIYEFIEGTFRPNTNKLLDLLAGTALYDDPLLAIRELVQNSMDAIKQQIAYKSLLQKNPLEKKKLLELQRQYLVKITLSKIKDEHWLICEDNGTGMTKEILQKYFLISGNIRRYELKQLERKCLSKGFYLERTGRFGIGVLSYFMLAEKVIVESKPDQYAFPGIHNSWSFEINGIQEFGELKLLKRNQPGTTIKILLKPTIVEKYPKLSDSISGLLKKYLRVVPCNFEYNDTINNDNNFLLGPGWTIKPSYYKENLIKSFSKFLETQLKYSEEFASEKIESLIKNYEGEKTKIIEDFSRCLSIKTVEIKLENNLGRVRYHIPYFNLIGGKSLVYFWLEKIDNKVVAKKFLNGYQIKVRDIAFSDSQAQSFFGIRCNFELGLIHHLRWSKGEDFFTEIDIAHPKFGNINISRDVLVLSDIGKKIYLDLLSKGKSLLLNTIKSFDDKYSFINEIAFEAKTNCSDHPFWFYRNKTENTIELRKLRLPIFQLFTSNTFAEDGWYQKQGRKKSLAFVSKSISSFKEYSSISIEEDLLLPTKLVLVDNFYRYNFCLIYKDFPLVYKNGQGLSETLFPSTWENLIGVCETNSDGKFKLETLILNANNSLVKLITNGNITWTKNLLTNPNLNLDLINEATQEKSKAAGLILFCLLNNNKELWLGLNRKQKKHIDKIWKLILSKISSDLYLYLDYFRDSKLIVLSRDKWMEIPAEGTFNKETKKYEYKIRKYLPKPDTEWLIYQPPKKKFNSVVTMK